jgi:hypothetical protein
MERKVLVQTIKRPTESASAASSLGGLASLLPNEKRNHRGLSSALLTSDSLGVGIWCRYLE